MLEFLKALASVSTWRFAWRNIGRNPRRTAIIGSAVAIGVGGTILAVAITYGMIGGMVATTIDNELGHLQVHAPGFSEKPSLDYRLQGAAQIEGPFAEGLPGLEGWAPRVRHEGLVSSPRASLGVRVIGIDPVREIHVTALDESLVEGEYLIGEKRRVVLGARLARRLHVGLGDKVVLSVQDLSGDLTGEAFRVAGLFETASRDLDNSAVYLDLGEAQTLLGMGSSVSELAVRLDDDQSTAAAAAALRSRFGDSAEVRTWGEMRPLLVAMASMFDQMGWILYGAVFIAMAFGIANVLLMSLYERIREIGIQMALGMKPPRLIASLMAESFILTLAGVAVGVGLAELGVFAFADGLDLSAWADGLTAYGIPPKLVPILRAEDLQTPVLIAILTAILASLWPALRASRIRPAEAIRHV